MIDKRGGIITGIDIIERITAPYEAKEVERVLLSMMDNWCSLVPVEGELSPLEKLLGVKGYAKAVKGKKLIHFTWSKKNGYSIVPTIREKTGFVVNEDKIINLGEVITTESLIEALYHALEISTAL